MTISLKKNLVFGFKQGSSQIFQSCSDSIRFIMTREKHYILHYIDDLLIFGHNNKCYEGFKRLHVLLEELGFISAQCDISLNVCYVARK